MGSVPLNDLFEIETDSLGPPPLTEAGGDVAHREPFDRHLLRSGGEAPRDQRCRRQAAASGCATALTGWPGA